MPNHRDARFTTAEEHWAKLVFATAQHLQVVVVAQSLWKVEMMVSLSK